MTGSTRQAPSAATTWEYTLVPLKEAGDLKKGSSELRPQRHNELGSEGWEAVGMTLKRGDLVAWPVVLLKRPVD
jgi:hypothetical protein